MNGEVTGEGATTAKANTLEGWGGYFRGWMLASEAAVQHPNPVVEYSCS